MNARVTSPEEESDGRRWTGQARGARALRIVIAVLPTVVATMVVLALIRIVPESSSVPVPVRVASILAVAVAGFVVASATNRFTVRLLPLAALMRLSLVFPDQAPSRLKLAIRAASSKKLKAEVESARHHGLSSDSTEAAGQVLLLTSALGEHDRRTRGHSERVRLYARMLGEELGVTGDDLERLQWGALLHDVGKLTIPAEILNKPGRLDRTEWAIMSGHAAAGSELVAPLHPFLGEFVAAADSHHEKWDGTGYPLGLSGEAIPLAARIVAVADAYEVMTAVRAYKKSMSPEAARAELTASAGTHFDPDVVRAWLRLSVGDVNKAAGPAAALAGIPLLGEVFGLFARTASQLSVVPAAVATAAPAAATAGAMTMAMVAAPPPPLLPAEIVMDLTPSTTEYRPAGLDGVPTTLEAPTTTVVGSIPPTTATTTSSTSAPPTSTVVAGNNGTSPTAPPTTSAPTTSTTVAPTTTTAAPTTTATPPPLDTFAVIDDTGGGPLSIEGWLSADTDVSGKGPYGGGAHLFRDPAQTLAEDLDVGGTVIPAGTVVCVHLFVSSDADDDSTWRIDYLTQVLALASTSDDLAATDWLQASGVDYGSPKKRELEDDEDASIKRDGTRVRIRLDEGSPDQVRIFLDCTP